MKKFLLCALKFSLLSGGSFAKDMSWKKYVPEIGKKHIPDEVKNARSNKEEAPGESDWIRYVPDHAKQYIRKIENSDKNRSTYVGPTSLFEKKLKNVTLMGPGFIEKSKIGTLDVSGPTEIKKSEIKNLTVRGGLKILGPSKIRKDVLVTGIFEADDTKFYGNLEIYSTKVIFKDCYIKGDVTIISETLVPEVFLEGTTIEGRIYFKKRDGYVHNDSSIIKKGIFGERA